MPRSRAEVSRGLRLGVDIGGTFTDIVAVLDGAVVYSQKVLSSTDDYSRSIVAGISTILEQAQVHPWAVHEVVHGTTVATNAILERKGAKTGLLTTFGFRDVLDIRHSRRPEMYNIYWEKPPALVERYLRQEVDERLDCYGNVVRPLDLESADRAIEKLQRHGVESVAVCLLNSFADPAHELALGELLRERLPGVSISLSCQVLPEAKEYERTSTTCINAYVRPVVERYLTSLEEQLTGMGIGAPLLTMQSNGGIMSARAAAERPVHIIESGPAAGVVGALELVRRMGHSKAITLDMGGTTAKAALIEEGRISFSTEYEVGSGISVGNRLNKGGGYLLSTPSIDVAEVGTGGGSIAWLDEAKAIHVGPKSAGALPGPICYDAGGESPTVTDANVLLGYLNSEYLVGGDLRLNTAKAREVFTEAIAEPLGMSVEEAAYGVHVVANSTMTRAIRAISTERGRDPRDALLVAFGGNGPVHAAELARALGMKDVVVPRSPGLFSAFGLLETSIEHHYSRTRMRVLNQENLDDLNAALEGLEEDARADLKSAGYGDPAVTWVRKADVRYRGQASQLTVDLPGPRLTVELLPRLRARFEEEHERTFGYRSHEEPVELVNLRLTARLERRQTSEVDLRGLVQGDQRAGKAGATRRAYFGPAYGFLETAVVARRDLGREPRVGPLIVEEYDATTVVPPGCTVSVDEFGNILIHLVPANEGELIDPRYDPITRELVRHSLESITDEMAITLTRTCRSGHVKYSGDFSTALGDARGQLLAQGLTLPFHLGGIPDVLAAVLEKFGGRIEEGDVFVMNDPFGGGMHLADVFLVKPVFHQGKMVAMATSIVHHVDIGGQTAGGNATNNTEIYGEGLRVPMLKLFERGVPNEAIFEIFRANVRVPVKVVGDLRAELAACERGEQDYLALIERFGPENLERYQQQLMDSSEQAARSTILSIPDGSYEFQDYLDGDSVDPDPIPLHVTLTVAGDSITVDCSRSSPQVRGGINSTPSATKSVAYASLRCLMPSHASTNCGYMRPIRVIAPPGSVLNGVLPAAGAGRAATGYRLMDVIFGALAKAMPDRLMAAGDGSPIIFSMGGYDENRTPFVFVDLVRGSWGGRPMADGLSGTTLSLSTGSSVPAEIVELEHPARLEYHGYLPDSCGDGTFRGGMTVMREYRLLADDAVLQYRCDRRKFRPYGLNGGLPGYPSIVVWNPDGQAQLLPEKFVVRMRRGDVIRFCQASGGGYGEPLLRDPRKVWEDVRDELISVGRARQAYGVAIEETTLKLDLEETERLRSTRRSASPPTGQVEVVPAQPQDVKFIVDTAHREARDRRNPRSPGLPS